MQVGDLIQCEDYLGGSFSTGLVCKIELVCREDGFGDTSIEVRCWAVWADGTYTWVTEEDEPLVISA